MRVFLLHSKRSEDPGPLWWNVEYIGFTDGAWERLSSGHFKSGIGGILMNSMKYIIFTFSGNFKALNPLVAE